MPSCSPPGSDGLHSPGSWVADICLHFWRCPEALHSSVFRLSCSDLPRHLKFHCGQCLVEVFPVPCLYIADCARGHIKLWQSLTPQCWAVLPAPESQPESLAHRICTLTENRSGVVQGRGQHNYGMQAKSGWVPVWEIVLLAPSHASSSRLCCIHATQQS